MNDNSTEGVYHTLLIMLAEQDTKTYTIWELVVNYHQTRSILYDQGELYPCITSITTRLIQLYPNNDQQVLKMYQPCPR